ncbi:HlyD family secretion protein [Pinibacter aurantiacus]|uniref:HlyD family secretion protein n=1 Tax=Pinibacter aurantiacus TaxID=2851599 RepID=A0A9E2W5Q8_9BACT|nr:HlyD family secretion protein [Pinibacter aurantiacus]MBV4359149.1 HlyD family secretion protein [Pinibacter aurantiacus]
METQTQNKVASSNHTEGAHNHEQPKKRNFGFIIVLAALVIGGGTFGISKYVHGQHHEETDDAQIDANISPVIPRVSGYVTEVRAKDNQIVKKGDTLIILDNRDLLIKVEEAEAALLGAKSNLSVAEATTNASKANIVTSQASITTADAQIEAAKVNVWRATQDYERYANLIKDHSITQQQYEQALAAKQTAERQLQVLVEQKNAAAKQTAATASQSNATSQQIAVANAVIKQREADLANAKLNLSYAVVLAPADGKISKVSAQVGQYLQAGQSLFSVVLDQSTWVTANYKETQLSKMRVGQKAIITIDAFPGHKFEATLASFSPATGSRFALLPPDNATGNFVKVVQRLPVKLEFTNPSDSLVKQLRPGMNVNVDVHLD